MSDIISIDLATGETVLRSMTSAEEALLAADRAQALLDAQAEAAEETRRNTRRQLYQQIQDIASPSWSAIATALIDARTAIGRPTAQWTNQLVIDGVKLALRIGVFLVARELRRVYQNREPD